MWKMIIVCLMMLFVASPVYAEWDSVDTSLLLLRLVDWVQTRDIATATELTYHWDEKADPASPPEIGWRFKHGEANPLLGEHPTIDQVNTYFILCIGTDYLIAKYTSPKWHRVWQVISFTIETYCVTHNIQVGVGMKF